MQLRAQNHIFGVIVKRARPRFLANSEVSGSYFVHDLQAAVLTSLVPVQTSCRLGPIGVVHHAVVHAAVQFLGIPWMHAVVEVGQDALDGLATPKVPDAGSAPTAVAEVSLDDDGSESVCEYVCIREG